MTALSLAGYRCDQEYGISLFSFFFCPETSAGESHTIFTTLTGSALIFGSSTLFPETLGTLLAIVISHTRQASCSGPGDTQTSGTVTDICVGEEKEEEKGKNRGRERDTESDSRMRTV